MADNDDWGGDFGDFEGADDANNNQQQDRDNDAEGWGKFGNFDEAPAEL